MAMASLIVPPALYVLGVFFIVAFVCVVPRVFCLRLVGVSDLPKIKFLWLVLFLLSVAVCITWLDLPITKFMLSLHTPANMAFFKFISACAEGWFVVGVLATIFMVALVFNYTRMLFKLRLAFYSLIYVGIINTLLKVILNRTRPATDLNSHQIFNYIFNPDFKLKSIFYAANSMPSGHTITIVAGLFPFIYYSKSRWVRWMLVSLCLLVMLSRVWTLNHWFSDVYVASVLASYISYAIIIKNKDAFRE